MIPYATCMQLRKSGKRRSDGRRWVAFSQFDDSNANQEDGASAGVSGAQDAPSRPMPVRVEAQSSNGVISFIWSTPDVCPEIQVDAHFHVVDDDCMMPKEDDDTSTLSTRVCRRRSSSSIRFADDTDTGTDILMITEEGLEEILVDPTGTTIPSSAESTLKLSPVTSASSTPHFIGIHRYHVAGAGALKVPCDVNDQAALQNRMLLTLRRRKSGQKSIHIDPIALLDYSYHGVTQRFLHNACNWGFNSFTLDTLTGGHSLSQLLGYLFTRYNFIEIFDLDVVNTWKLFRLFENGYHDTNPYHNSVHAADVTQAMHCFIEEEKISKYMTPMEKMCSLLAAVAHDLDHPGVNQHFLIATKSHLASLYNNLSVLESHHWRFAISCIRESKVFDHFDGEQWEKVQHLLSSLILATDITQQASYLLRFRKYLSSPETFSMEDPENRLFILQIALKCADLCNPCRPWLLSHKWTTQICAEFYRQGDYEKMLKIPVTPICNRQIASMAKIQIDFFRNVVSPLFELWDQFLSSRLSRKILNNLRFNNSQWESSYTQLRSTRRHSCSVSEGCRSGAPIRLSKSVSDLKVDLKVPDIRDLRDFSATIKIDDHKKTCDGVNGCGTPSITSSGSPSPSSEDCTQSEQYRDNIGNLRSPFINLGSLPSHHLKPISSQSLLDTAQYLSGRRGSAPGCIGIYTSCELAAAAALVFLHGAVTSKHPKRRSSFPVEHADGCFPYNNTSTGYHHRHYNGAKLNWPHMGPKIKGRSLEVLMTSLSAKNKLLTRQACSLDSSAEFKQWLMNSKPRRGSIPQEILIESLANYSSQEGL